MVVEVFLIFGWMIFPLFSFHCDEIDLMLWLDAALAEGKESKSIPHHERI